MNCCQVMKLILSIIALSFIALPDRIAHSTVQNRPRLELFPMPVLENLRKTAASANSLESSLEDVIKDMDLQMTVYEASRCHGAIDDIGCHEIERALRQSYTVLLDRMIDALPSMERLVESTRLNLASTLRSQVGMSLSPRELQRAVAQKPSTDLARRGAGSRPGRLSQQFARYYELVSRAKGQETTATMAAAIYLDSREALDWIRLTRQDMQAARTELEISAAFGSFSPQMIDTVQQVKGLLFGEVPALPDAPDPMLGATDPNVRALEID